MIFMTHTIGRLLSGLVLGIVFFGSMMGVGSGFAAFLIQQDVTVIDGNTTVYPGEKVAVSIVVDYFSKNITGRGVLMLKTDLENEVWTVNLSRNGECIRTLHPAFPYEYISGFDLASDSTLEVQITVVGTVPKDAVGKQINPIILTEKGTRKSGVVGYKSPILTVVSPDLEITQTPSLSPTELPSVPIVVEPSISRAYFHLNPKAVK